MASTRAELEDTREEFAAVTAEVDLLRESLATSVSADDESDDAVDELRTALFGAGGEPRGQRDLIGGLQGSIDDLQGAVSRLGAEIDSTPAAASSFDVQTVRNSLQRIEQCVSALVSAVESDDSFGLSLRCR